MNIIEAGEIFTISDKGEEEQQVEVLAKMTVEGIDYVAVSFLDDIEDDTDDDMDIFFLKVDEDGDIAPIATDQEFQKVSAAFDEVMEAEEME
ncbi:uncharacterized protein YrzB (UPF0473 family) [Salirhabdus euzebyi]|uniref:Uncharacterized protein YrzB (UPF0473 family) n=1 Tax=Salirhabdus euzebyi TaxID=394506 RepID=A0A841PUP5_9BACI|nr:DUF1292 domain-containing protein [Salirhabdus euzebyi]MBB6452530.1 uncharacterized protein YrzB (UPF0473 family) [Salirhabdus euzebyi]